jgi:hypothetical protein
MKRWFLIISFCLLPIHPLMGDSYFYPVGSLATSTGFKIFFIYQESFDHLELWSWDTSTQEVIKELSSQYTPAGFQLLPDGSGFSFIDNGIIKIKQFHKRSPRSLEIYEPISDITLISWKNSSTCYFHARAGKHYALFQLSIDGDPQTLISDACADCMYPCLVEDQLFYIQHGQQGYQIIRTGYVEGEYEKKEKILSLGNQPIAFLSMLNQHEGFFVMYSESIDRSREIVCFQYKYFFFDEMSGWCVEKLFNFCFPLNFLIFDNKQVLYESLLPFLPRRFKNEIYFTSVNEKGFLHIEHYSLVEKSIVDNPDCSFFTPKTENSSLALHSHLSNQATHLFAPMVINKDLIICGLQILDMVKPNM